MTFIYLTAGTLLLSWLVYRMGYANGFQDGKQATELRNANFVAKQMKDVLHGTAHGRS